MRPKKFLLSLPVVLALPIAALCGCSGAPTSPSLATTQSAASPNPAGVSREMLVKWAAQHEAWHQRLAASGLALSPSGSLDPVPLPGGFAPGAHVFVPGPPEFGLQGLNVEPGTVTDFNGFSAVGYFAGTAAGSDGVTYDMLNDMRLQQGTYIAVDGSPRRGTFALT